MHTGLLFPFYSLNNTSTTRSNISFVDKLLPHALDTRVHIFPCRGSAIMHRSTSPCLVCSSPNSCSSWYAYAHVSPQSPLICKDRSNQLLAFSICRSSKNILTNQIRHHHLFLRFDLPSQGTRYQMIIRTLSPCLCCFGFLGDFILRKYTR